jgi:hypothetical protein
MSDQIIINITPDPSINISAVDNNEKIDLNALTLNQGLINITPDPSTNISAVDNNEQINLNALTLNQGLINHSVTHQSGGSDALAHNLLGGLNGGQSGQYYHLTQNQYDNAVYRYNLPVYQTGTQTISGVKTFTNRPTVNGIGVLLSGEGSGGGGSVSGDYLPITGGTISGSLNVTGNTTVSGSIYATSGIYATGTIITNDDIEVTDFAKGVILKSSDGSRFRITVNNSGALTTEQL